MRKMCISFNKMNGDSHVVWQEVVCALAEIAFENEIENIQTKVFDQYPWDSSIWENKKSQS